VSVEGVRDLHRGPLIRAGILLGIGLGGFVDGIVLHQILQWHHMLSSGPYPPTSLENLEVNTLWDGLFHAATWLATAVGLGMLWRAGRRLDVPWSANLLLGSMAIGWGLFNLVEGFVDHHLLGIHHVREDVPNVLLWDLGFLLSGALLVAVGWLLLQAGRADTRTLDAAGGGPPGTGVVAH
jgi:uncharacterized membrane protein